MTQAKRRHDVGPGPGERRSRARSRAGGISFEKWPAQRESDNGPLDLRLWLAALDVAPRGDVREGDVRTWVQDSLQRFLPFEKFIGCYGELAAGRIEMKRTIACNYPQPFLNELDESFDLQNRGCFRWWVMMRKPFLLDPAEPPDFATTKEIEEAKRFRLGLIAAHGVIDPIANCGTYLSFAGVQRDDSSILRKLEIVAPTLHALFLASMGRVRSKLSEAGLTPRQRDIARLLIAGKSNRAIAEMLGLKEKTVRNTSSAVYERLGVTGRGALAALLR